MLRDQFAEPEPLVEFTHQDQATFRSDAGALELDLERGVEGELKGPILYLTHWVLTSRTFLPRSHPYQHLGWRHSEGSELRLKMEISFYRLFARFKPSSV